MPETGAIRCLDVPQADWLRFENALDQGQKVSTDFDPMLAKLVVHGETRDAAIDRSVSALQDLTLLGVKTNIDYLTRVLDHVAFRGGDLHTGFVVEHADELQAQAPDGTILAQALIAAALGLRDFRSLAFETPQPYAAIGQWRN
jgi:propionyl-CoA carboxylase alpha chain/3-methylcrotonyl-CoA carboxylase alpha subunit/acetyl-CoA/propionyl-CoA carboxylase biotin carboxyl carrier protein